MACVVTGTDVVPAVNQVELHPYFTQPALREVHAELGIPPRRGRRSAASWSTCPAATSPAAR